MAGGEVLCAPSSSRLLQFRDKGQEVGDCQHQGTQGCVTQNWQLAASSVGQPTEAAQAAARDREQGWGHLRAGSLSGTRFSVDAITYKGRPGHPEDKQDNTGIAFGSETSHRTPGEQAQVS